MEEQAIKIQRSTSLIKAFMVLVVVMQVVQFYQHHEIDFGAVAGAIGVLLLLRGFLLSPVVLATPVKKWFKPKNVFTKASYAYFFFAFVFIVVSAF